ncbi:MAG: cytochrome c, partial [Sneathiellales bacterium]|nr:cytochrome c [Sneathiellales bacterium]
DEVALWDIDVRPDGQGLPKGSGTVTDGETLYAERCASCHGEFGEGNGRWPVLAGGEDSLETDDPVKTIGSYWPYLSTVYDYIRRAMPFGEAQTLTADETYAIVAYLLYLNDMMDEEGTLSRENFTSFKLPNEGNFIEDARPDVPLVQGKEPCMKDCKVEVKILKRARVLDVTPDSED